jgi:hypothetical protein
MTSDTSIYLHIPFCIHRCAYCDFNTYAGQEDSIPAYVDALLREIHYIATTRPLDYQTIGTIFFGGGTPSLLSGSQLALPRWNSCTKSAPQDSTVSPSASNPPTLMNSTRSNAPTISLT